jgi:predicted DNA-binding transcriptional regulator AlpA
MLQHSALNTPAVQTAPSVSLGVINIDGVCEILGVSRTWIEQQIRRDKTFPRPFRIGARRHIKVSDLQMWVDQKARAA